MSSSRRDYYRRTRKVRMRELNPSKPGWAGLCLSLGSALLFWLAVGFSYMREGEARFFVGSAGLFALVMAAGGLALGVMGCLEEGVRPNPPRTAAALGGVMTALLLGLYVYGFFGGIG